MTTTVPSGPAAAAKARCPHLLFHNFLGTETVAALLNHVAVRERDFTPAKVRNRNSGRSRVDPAARDCRFLKDFGSFKASFWACLDRITAQALQQLGLFESAAEPSEFEICAYGDGGHFAPHIDTFETLDRVRILSCVYFFAAAPRRFSGGILRLYGFPSLSAKNELAPQIVDIEPETDTLLVFPSWLRHEVMPVEVPSRAWADARFTITCWIHRASQPGPAGDRPRGGRSQITTRYRNQ